MNNFKRLPNNKIMLYFSLNYYFHKSRKICGFPEQNIQKSLYLCFLIIHMFLFTEILIVNFIYFFINTIKNLRLFFRYLSLKSNLKTVRIQLYKNCFPGYIFSVTGEKAIERKDIIFGRYGYPAGSLAGITLFCLF